MVAGAEEPHPGKNDEAAIAAVLCKRRRRVRLVRTCDESIAIVPGELYPT